jgi:hypothetical protein
MRCHRDIVTAAGADADLAPMIAEDVNPFNVRDWRLRNSIPANRWKRFVDLGFTTYEELAAQAPLPAQQAA